MKAWACYIDIDETCCAWTRELMKEGFIAPGEVMCASVKDVQANDLRKFTQIHAFCGVSVWSHALRQAGWPDDREIWTGSAPCQPFSVAGAQRGTSDPRHLWPDFFRLIDARRPPVIMGEQVSGAAGYAWFDGVASDLESKDYACRAVDIPACAADAPHQRNRLYWVAVVHPAVKRRRQGRAEPIVRLNGDAASASADARQPLGDTYVPVLAQRQSVSRDPRAQRATVERTDDAAVRSFWHDAEWITCHDGKARRTKPRISLLVAGSSTRIPMWRALGNALCAPLAIEVIKAFMESEKDGSAPTLT